MALRWRGEGAAMNSPEDGAEVPQRSLGTLWHKFTQQRLRVWQPILAPYWIIAIYISGGLLLLGLGVATLLISWRVVEYTYDYTDLADSNGGLGSFEIQITRDMTPPIWLYYQLDGFHQNHRRYVQSRCDPQLKDVAPSRYAQGEHLGCRPWVTDPMGRMHYPCGLVARSVFNDTYALVLKTAGEERGEVLTVNSSASTIAWSADTHGRYKNVDPEERPPPQAGVGARDNQLAMNMWILERFPPVTCEQTEISSAVPYSPATVARRTERLEDGRTVEVADCRLYMTSRPECNFVREGRPFTCEGSYKKVYQRDNWGIENGHFLVWMRIAGLPSFRKLWGKLDTTIYAGSTVTVHFQDRFEVKEFRGRKAFVISTSSMLGGRSDFLGYSYIIVGSCCFIFGITFLWRYTVHGTRPLGDPTRLIPNER